MFCCVFFFCFVSFYPFSLQSIRTISNCLVPNCVFHNPVGLGWFDPAALGPGLWLLSQGGLGLFLRVRMMEDWGGPWWLGGSTGSSLVCLHLWVLVCVESLVPFGQGLRFPWARGLPAFGGVRIFTWWWEGASSGASCHHSFLVLAPTAQEIIPESIFGQTVLTQAASH